jgi:polysaccharide chain length determinant protein (PEP-CTERM system associated)
VVLDAETLTMLPGKTYSSQEIVRILGRHWWLVALPLLIGLGIGIVVYMQMPVRYRSETLITVVPQRVPESYVKSTISTRIEDRLPAISEQILSRSRLERIVTEFDLLKEQRSSMPLEDVVQEVRADVHVDPVGRESFRVSFLSGDAKTAQKVTERLASLVIEENIRDREKFSDNTNQFLQSQLEEARRRLSEQEKKLEAYRKNYQGQLPTELTGNLQAIQNVQSQLAQTNQAINHARERRLLLERQIADAQSPEPTFPAVPGGPISDDAPAAQKLEAARANLEAVKRHYTAEHPDVRALERQIADLQVKAEQEAKLPAPKKPLSPTEVARQKRLKELQTDMELIDREIAQGLSDVATLKRSIGEYQSKIDAVPSRETDLVALMRDYETLNKSYQDLLAKQEESKLAANLERRQIGEQLRIVDPASFPEKPSNQKERLAALFGGGLGGLLLGILLVGFIEYRDSSFKTEEDVARVLTLPVLALIPVMMAGQSSPHPNRKGRALQS